jgi:hypothetical protein
MRESELLTCRESNLLDRRFGTASGTSPVCHKSLTWIYMRCGVGISLESFSEVLTAYRLSDVVYSC